MQSDNKFNLRNAKAKANSNKANKANANKVKNANNNKVKANSTNAKKNNKRLYKRNEESDNDDDEEEDAENSSEEDEVEEKQNQKVEKFDKKKYISMLAEMFPSRHMSERVKQMERNDAIAKKSEAFKRWANRVRDNKQQQRIAPTVVKRRRLKKIIVSESDAEGTDEEEAEASEVASESGSDDGEEDANGAEGTDEEEDDSDSSYRPDESEAEDEDDAEGTEEDASEEEDYDEAESTDEEEDYDEAECSDEEEVINSGKINVKNPGKIDSGLSKYNIILSVGNPNFSKRNNQDNYFQDDEEEDDEEKMKDEPENENALVVYNEKEAEALASLKKMIASLTEKEKKNKTIMKMLVDFEKREKAYNKGLDKHISKLKEKNTRKLTNLLSEKNVMNDVKYFHEKLSLEEQQNVLKQMVEIKSHTAIVKPYRLALLDADMPVQFKAIAYKKINTLKYMEQGGGEYYKIKNWVDTFMQIPFGKTKNLPVTIDDGVEKCHEFMENASKILNEAVYGLDDVKLQIMQMVGQWISNPKAMGTAIAIKGPMGTGKTSLVKEGISKILGREFAFIALGGATDSSFLEGHSYTYEGSTWGKIVDILVKCKSMNPVIFFDELDKVSDTAKGEEIIGILTHLTDTTQNSKFHDKYFSELEFDLSKCLFIFSYNDEAKVNPILKDRMYRIETKGYDAPEKFVISKDYLLPKICEQVKFAKEDIVIPEETIKYLITNHTDGEQGVRNLKRCLEIIYTKLNLYRLMKPGSNLFKKEMSLDIKFPMTVTTDVVDKLIKKNENENWTHKIMYM